MSSGNSETDFSTEVSHLSDDIVSACLEPEVLGQILYSRQEFIRPLLSMIKTGENGIMIKAAIGLGHRNLGAESISRLVALLAVNPASELAECKSRVAARILAQQDQLPMKIISTLFQIISQNRDKSLLYHLRTNQSTELFYTHLETTCNLGGTFILEFLLSSLFVGFRNDNISPVWIDGETISSYIFNGEIGSLHLKDELSFRAKFREAQRIADFPEWACISLENITRSLRNVTRALVFCLEQ